MCDGVEEMKPAVKKRWVKALRSGEYEQTQARLHDEDGFCCLGVLLDVEHSFDWEWDEYAKCWCIDGNHIHLPGFEFNHEYKLSVSEEETLAGMNDDGCTFPEIADWIEENL
jgi:hypothetical protein